MATYYLPDETGWQEDHGYSHWLRLKIVQSYNSATNSSALTITPQAKCGSSAQLFHVMDNSSLKAGSTTLMAKGSDTGSASTPFRFAHTDGGWTDMTQENGSVKSYSIVLAHDANGDASLSFDMHGRFSSDSSVHRSFFDNGSATLSLSEDVSYTLTISAGSGATVTVRRNGTALPNGAAIRNGEVLTVSFSAQTGYELTSHTLNGASFPSGGTHTVAGAVTVAAAAVKKTYALTVSAGTGSTVTVRRNGTALANGAALTHGDVLTVSFAAARGYALTSHTVNGAAFTSGGTLTVTGAVTAAASARLLGAVWLDTGSGLQKYVLRLDTGSAWVPVKLFVDLGAQIIEV